MPAIVFSLPPAPNDAPYLVRWSWLTQIHRSQNDTEQRAQLRVIPRRQDAFTVRSLAKRSSGWLDALLFGGNDTQWAVPYWPHGVRLTAAAAAGASVPLAVPATAYRAFEEDGQAILWRSEAEHELVTIEALAAQSVTAAALAAAWPAGTVLLPARLARLADATDLGRLFAAGQDASVAFDYELGTEPGIATPAEPPVFDVAGVRPAAAAGLEASRWRLDNNTYTFADYPRGTTPLGRRQVPIWLPDLAAQAAVLEFFHSLKGALTEFWLPTYQADYAVTAGLGTAALTIERVGYTERAFPHEARRHLGLIQPGGSVVHRHIDASVDNGAGAGTESWTLDAAAPAATSLVSQLLYGRLADDVLELRHYNSRFAEATLSFLELPRSVPAAA